MMNFKEKDFSCWFPGHMRKSRNIIIENLKNIDIVYEIVDARAPKSTRNIAIEDMVKNKLRLIILGKSDLCESFSVKLWVEKFKKEGVFSVALDCRNFKQVREVLNISIKLLEDLKIKRQKKNVSEKRFRAMVVGIPNIGKSTLINSLVGRKKAKIGNFPGVTKSKQWIFLDEKIDLLDTPGNLSYEDRLDKESCFILELIGAVKFGVFDEEEVAFNFLKFLYENRKDVLCKIFDVKDLVFSDNLLEQYGRKKNMLIKGGKIDIKRASESLINDFREGKFGKITLQVP